MRKQLSYVLAGLLGTLVATTPVLASDDVYEVTITNITGSFTFTPIMVASHKKGVTLFTTGEPASYELGRIAEGGDIVPMTDLLLANDDVVDVQSSGAPLAPGASVTVTVSAEDGAKNISLASMLLPTNDAFFALNGVKAKGRSRVHTSPAYDAGTETNDELCANIPGGFCGGIPFSPEDEGEGYVFIHSGIHGVGDLDPAVHDWRNPVAKITIKKVKVDDDD